MAWLYLKGISTVVYCLRTNVIDWDQETLWRTYAMLTDLESVFHSLKSELGLSPVCHLSISVLAYQLVQIIRRQLREHGETASWATLRHILEGQPRVTTTFRRKDGRLITGTSHNRPECTGT